jgi:hypothetical protein
MREQVFWIDQNGIQQSQWIAREGHEVKKWIGRNGSGQVLVSYTLLLGIVSTIAAISYGLFVGVFNSMLLAIITSMP